MNSRHLMASCVGFLVCGASASEPLTGAQLAEHMDRVRRPTKSFRVRVTLTEIREGRTSRVGEFDVFARKVSGYPDFDTVTVCMDPEEDRGKVLLTKGTEAWMYDPKAKRPVPISYEKMRSHFFVAYGLTSSFVQEYDVDYRGVEKVLDAARVERNCHAYRLEHRAKKQMVPGSLEYWIDAETLRPVKGRIYSSSGRLLHTAYYTRFEEVLGEVRPTRLPIVSAVERGLITDARFSQFAFVSIPEMFCTVDAMPAISKGARP